MYGDENAVPTAGISKTIHQRNKSSPALSTMATKSSKRTAFGDVSNTANLARPAKDDLILNGKNSFKPTDKLIVPQDEKKPVTFQKPAQRPSSISGLKSLLGGMTNVKEALVKQPMGEVQQNNQSAPQPANTKKITAKKSTMVFKDVSTSQVGSVSAEPAKSFPSTAPTVPVHHELPARQTLDRSQDVLEPQLRRAPSKYMDAPEIAPVVAAHADHATKQVVFKEAPAARSDGVYIDGNGAVQVYDFDDLAEYPEETVELAGTTVSNAKNATENSGVGALDQLLSIQPSKEMHQAAQTSTLAPVPEPEEYWEEEGVENCDEEGYVTARSFKSRTDNTTGNATTVLFPKVTLKTKKEIAAAKELIEGSKTVEDIEDEAWDTTMVAEYGDEIFGYMRDLEVYFPNGHSWIYVLTMSQIKMLPNAHYMDNQAEIQWSMRAVLMDWIVQVHHRFNLLPETLFLCVNYIDRFLSCKVVSLGKLQLVGATAIFIAAKYEEIDCPSVQEIVYMVDNGYNQDEILKAERFMLSMLQFELGWPGPMSFLRRISKADDYDLETRTLAKYFLEITIMDERFVGSPPSFVAAGAHCLARLMLRKGTWVSASTWLYPSRRIDTNVPPVNCARLLLQLHLLPAIQPPIADDRMLRGCSQAPLCCLRQIYRQAIQTRIAIL